MTARFIVADVFDGLASLDDHSIDLVITSPPFLALRSYLPADHPDKDKEIGSEPTPAEFIDTLLAITGELRRVLAPHGSIAIELGDTYSGSGGAGGDYDEGGLRERQEKFVGSGRMRSGAKDAPQDEIAEGEHLVHYPGHPMGAIRNMNNKIQGGGPGWPLAKSKTLIAELYRIALAYGFNPLTGQPSPAGRWRVRNVVTWARPNPPVGALGDKWRPATSDVVVACTSDKRYWDDLATRRPHAREYKPGEHDAGPKRLAKTDGGWNTLGDWNEPHPAGAPLLDYWEIPPTGYPGAHYAVYPPALVTPLVKAMCPQKVCRECGEPSRRITETTNAVGVSTGRRSWREDADTNDLMHTGDHSVSVSTTPTAEKVTAGWTDCGHDNWRPGLVLDPFAGSGTTLAVATGHGHDAIGIDLDPRNLELARDRVGPFFFEEVTI